MTSHLHETVLEMFRHRPELAPELLAGLLGMALPGYREARLGEAEVVELRTVAHRADAVVVLRDGPRTAVAVVVEVVVEVEVEVEVRRDEDKWWTWRRGRGRG